jgi:uncharacterized protein YcfJ
MEMNQSSNRIHPLMAGAAVSVILVSLLGVAAITGILPNSHGTAAPQAVAAAPAALPGDGSVANVSTTPAQYAAPAPAAPAQTVYHKHVVEHKHVAQRAAPVYTQAAPPTQYAQASTAASQPYQQPVQQPVQQAAKPTSGVGIAAGAVIGGLLGNQVGGGNGRTLATIAGAVGGGYVGNEVEKRTR